MIGDTLPVVVCHTVPAPYHPVSTPAPTGLIVKHRGVAADHRQHRKLPMLPTVGN